MGDERSTKGKDQAAELAERPEEYLDVNGALVRRVHRKSGPSVDTSLGKMTKAANSPSKRHDLWDERYLRAKTLPSVEGADLEITFADLFCGLGALSLGVVEAARALGVKATMDFAADHESPPLEVLRKTFGVDAQVARQVDLETALQPAASDLEMSPGERALLGDEPEKLDILVAGPPCQGHSRLNNHTRHDDPRNDLYGRVVRYAELRTPRLVIIENVDSVVNDDRESSSSAAERLRELDYCVDEGSVSLITLGVPQRRRRHVLVATRNGEPRIEIDAVVRSRKVQRKAERTVRWAVGDLVNRKEPAGFDAAGNLSEINEERIRWLHEDPERRDLDRLLRPACHQKNAQNGKPVERSYKSMYGKLSWGEPAQTITSGYGSMGQGRYVHPSEERTLTPHEAARLQFIPDFVRFDQVAGRGQWARMIGNVAPMKLSYIFVSEFLR